MSTAILGLGSDRRHQKDGKTTVFVMFHVISYIFSDFLHLKVSG